VLDRLRRLLRRRPAVVLVDADAWQQLTELAIYGDAVAIVEAESKRWHNLGVEERQ
jgi:hypothetical protein